MGTLLEDIQTVLRKYDGIADYKTIYKELSLLRNDGKELTDAQKAGVRKQIEDCSSDSQNFKGKSNLFFSTNGLGKGIWGLREYLSTKTTMDFDTAIVLEELGKSNTEREEIKIYRIIRDTKLSKKIKILYNNVCQICGTQIILNEKTYSEAHHIKPLGKPYNGPDTYDNLIVVCPNCHVMLDFGAIKIEKLKCSKHQISKENIEFHNNELFGKKN